jgi:predicted aldo/keto reductase-like oxidoreductase
MPEGSDNGVYTLISTTQDSMYVGEWRIELDQLWHKHSDNGDQEYAVNERTCWRCEATCPDSIWFAHRLQQLP